MLEPSFVLMDVVEALTDGIFETGAYKVLSESQNLTVLGQVGPSSTHMLSEFIQMLVYFVTLCLG